MAKKSPKQWVYNPKSAPKPKVPEDVKRHVQERCDTFVETTLKPHRIQPPPDEEQFSYIVELYNLWYRNFFYFCAKYRCPSPNCISEFFEVRYTRLEYTGKDTYTLSYMRHTGKWHVIFTDLSLDESISSIKSMEIFWP